MRIPRRDDDSQSMYRAGDDHNRTTFFRDFVCSITKYVGLHSSKDDLSTFNSLGLMPPNQVRNRFLINQKLRKGNEEGGRQIVGRSGPFSPFLRFVMTREESCHGFTGTRVHVYCTSRGTLSTGQSRQKQCDRASQFCR